MYIGYFAQGIPKIDAEIAENNHFWMKTRTQTVSCASKIGVAIGPAMT